MSKFNKILNFTLIILITLTLNLNITTITTNNKNYFDENEVAAEQENNSEDSIDETNENIEDDGYGSEKEKVELTIGENKLIFEDDANLLSQEEQDKLIDNMKRITEYGSVIFKTIDINSTSADYYAREFFHSRLGNGTNGTMFLIDMDNREIYIFSDGEMYDKYITSSKAYTITDNTYKYASNRDYYGCANEAFNEIYMILEGYKIAEPMRYITSGILALVLAALLGYLFSIKGSRLTKLNSSEATKCVNKSFDVVGEIRAVKTGERRVYNPPSDSGGSSGGGGGGGGGGSSGGGGGHSF